MSKINLEELRQAIKTLRNYIDIKIDNNDNGSSGEVNIDLSNYATIEYVNNKTSIENVIYEGNGTDDLVIHDYWTHCPVDDGSGCWVINKEIQLNSNNNPYYLEFDGITFSPEGSTYDEINSAWIYKDKYQGSKIFICNKYENQNCLIVPWDNMGCPNNVKVYSKEDISDVCATKSYVDNKLGNLSIQKITQTEYDSLETKDPNVLYLVTE